MLAGLLVENVKFVSPLEAVAVSVIGETPSATNDEGANVTDWLATVTRMSADTGRYAGLLAVSIAPQHATPLLTTAQLRLSAAETPVTLLPTGIADTGDIAGMKLSLKLPLLPSCPASL